MTLSLQVLIASGIFCVIIISLLLIQKKGYLKHKIFTILILFSSMLFLVAASAFFYYEYSGYRDLKKRVEKISKVNRQKQFESQFSDAEVNVLEELSEAKNELIGYDRFLEESARNYNPDDFSYANLLKETIILQLERKEYGLDYWNDIEQTVDSAYENNRLYRWERFPIAMIPGGPFTHDYDEGKFFEETPNEVLEHYSKLAYIQRKIKAFDRSSEGIEDLWSANKVFIYAILTKAKYNKISKTINDLIAVYDTVVQEPNYKEFYAVHNLFEETNAYNAVTYNEVFLSFPSKAIVASYANNWLFSFWDRRFEENNDQTVYQILKEIQSHYED